MESFTIIPIKGLRTNVPSDDYSLVESVSEGVAITNDVGGINIDYNRKRNAVSKSFGRSQWSNTATTTCMANLGIFQLDDGTNVSNWVFMGDGAGLGRVYRYDSSRDPVQVTSGANVWSDTEFYCAVQYASFMVFTDLDRTTTPYYADFNDVSLIKMLNSGTEYKCKYLEVFANRIVLANTDQTNGDIEIRWSDALPTLGSMSIAAGNQLFKSGNDSITGIKKFGPNNCFLYGKNSIDRIDYYSAYLTPFGITNMITGQGAVNHHSIVSTGYAHFFYNSSYGFVEYRGGVELPYGGKPISEPIENILTTINTSYADQIVGTFLPSRNEIAWTVPLYASATNNYILFYNIQTGQWRMEDKIANFVYAMRSWADFTWNDLVVALGGTGSLWTAAGSKRWADYAAERYDSLVLSNTDGHLYEYSSETDNGSDFDGYRIEPMLNFVKNDKSVLNEIWFNFAERGLFSLDVYYRQGDNVGDINATAWTSVGSLSTDNPANAVIYTPSSMHKAVRYHQIKYGCDAKNEAFSINSVQFRYVPEGRY